MPIVKWPTADVYAPLTDRCPLCGTWISRPGHHAEDDGGSHPCLDGLVSSPPRRFPRRERATTARVDEVIGRSTRKRP